MAYSCFEVELFKHQNVIRAARRLGYTDAQIEKRRVLYLTNRVYNDEERKSIIIAYKKKKSGLKKLLHVGKFSVHGIKIRTSASEELLAETKIEALLKRDQAISKRRSDKFILIPSSNERRYSVYVFELNKRVLEKSEFLNRNPNYNDSMPCLYVGQTSRTKEERFDIHINGDTGFSTIMRKYCISPEYQTAHFTPQAILALRLDSIDKSLSSLTYAESLYWEEELSNRLRALGYGVWFN